MTRFRNYLVINIIYRAYKNNNIALITARRQSEWTETVPEADPGEGGTPDADDVRVRSDARGAVPGGALPGVRRDGLPKLRHPRGDRYLLPVVRDGAGAPPCRLRRDRCRRAWDGRSADFSPRSRICSPAASTSRWTRRSPSRWE